MQSVALIVSQKIDHFTYDPLRKNLFLIESSTNRLYVYHPIICHPSSTMKVHSWPLNHLPQPIRSIQIDSSQGRLIFASDTELFTANIFDTNSTRRVYSSDRSILKFNYGTVTRGWQLGPIRFFCFRYRFSTNFLDCSTDSHRSTLLSPHLQRTVLAVSGHIRASSVPLAIHLFRCEIFFCSSRSIPFEFSRMASSILQDHNSRWDEFNYSVNVVLHRKFWRLPMKRFVSSSRFRITSTKTWILALKTVANSAETKSACRWVVLGFNASRLRNLRDRTTPKVFKVSILFCLGRLRRSHRMGRRRWAP